LTTGSLVVEGADSAIPAKAFVLIREDSDRILISTGSPLQVQEIVGSLSPRLLKERELRLPA